MSRWATTAADRLQTGAVLRAVPGVSKRQLHHWMAGGGVTPSVSPGNGSGGWAIWSARDVLRLDAIGGFVKDLRWLDDKRMNTIARIWRELEHSDTATIVTPTITVTVTIAPRDGAP